jgi:hypothetical protein
MSAAVGVRPEATTRPVTRPVWHALLFHQTHQLTTHPAVVASLAAILALWLIPLAAQPAGASFPYLTGASVTVQYPLLLLAGGTFAAANLVAMQPYRFAANEFESVLSLPRWQRAAALAIATLAPATGGLLVAGTQILIQTTASGAAGSIRPGEILTVPA